MPPGCWSEDEGEAETGGISVCERGCLGGQSGRDLGAGWHLRDLHVAEKHLELCLNPPQGHRFESPVVLEPLTAATLQPFLKR